MISLDYFFEKIKDVKLRDIGAFLPMSLAFMLKPFYRKKYQGAWLVCEEPFEARDNGYHFFKYVCKEQPQQKCFYAIKKSSVDFKKVENLGPTIEYGSLQHWLAYFLCEYNISSQKGGKPNAALCSFFELNSLFQTYNVFLQHGIIINNLKWLYKAYSKIDFFVTSTNQETDFVLENFGYDSNQIHCTGLPRFDGLHGFEETMNQIVVMPTWRYWFNIKSKMNNLIDTSIDGSAYVTNWIELLNSNRLQSLIKDYDLKVVFYLHRNMQKYINCFDGVSSLIDIKSWEDCDLQELLKQSVCMVTDYSSVFMDMVYMKKPVVFYQFDEDDYRKYQYSQGYFDYHCNPFGNCYNNCDDVIDELNLFLINNFSVSNEFLDAHANSFRYFDRNNCERIFNLLNNMELI